MINDTPPFHGENHDIKYTQQSIDIIWTIRWLDPSVGTNVAFSCNNNLRTILW